MSIFDDEHRLDEERRISMGLSSRGGVLVVHHTFEETDAHNVRVRIFSCRKATRREVRQYME